MMAGVRYNFGGNTAYDRPMRAPEIMQDTLRHTIDTTSDYVMNHIARYGEIKTAMSESSTETVRDITPQLPAMQLEYDANYN